MMYMVFLQLIISSIIHIISIMKIGLLILLLILGNVDNGELQFITHECRISKHKCDTIS